MGTLDVNKSMDVVKVQLRSFTWLTGQCMPLTSGTPSPSLKIPFKLGRCSSQEGPINSDKTPNDNVTSSIIEMKIRERERERAPFKFGRWSWRILLYALVKKAQ